MLKTRFLVPLLLVGMTGMAQLRAPASETAISPESGPELTLDYTGKATNDIKIADFTYFVALISPEPVTVSESVINTLQVRVGSIRAEEQSGRFSMTVEFDMTGEGYRHYDIDQSESLGRQAGRFAAGKKIERQLYYIRCEGSGKGSVAVEGRIEGTEKIVTALRLNFADRGGTSPVTVGLRDARSAGGVLKFENEIVARVNRLEFSREGTPPRMGVRVDSVRGKESGDNLFQDLKGQLVGMVANMILDPIAIAKLGNDTMLNFGHALVHRKPTFTLPAAKNLKNAPPHS